jgi:hypothetical protein
MKSSIVFIIVATIVMSGESEVTRVSLFTKRLYYIVLFLGEYSLTT